MSEPVTTFDIGRPVYPSNTAQVVRIPKVGYRGQLAASTGVLYTAPSITSAPEGTAPCTALLKSLNVCNTDTAQRTFTVTIVESGGSVADNRAIFKDATIPAKTTYTYVFDDETWPLGDGETINGLADSASKVTLRIGVVELSY